MTTNLNEQIRELIDSGARPVSCGEIMAGERPTTPRLGHVATLPAYRRRVAVVAGSVAAAGTAAAVVVALLGGARDRETPGGNGTVLTAAMVRHVAAKQVQADEAWSFVGEKRQELRPE